MRSPLKIFLLAVLLAGVNGSDNLPVSYDEGAFLEIFVLTFSNKVSRCYLVTPLKEVIDFPNEETVVNKYETRPSNDLTSCIVRVNNLDKQDEGLWSLHADMDSGNSVEHANIVIKGADSSQVEPNEPKSSENTSASKETLENNSIQSSSEQVSEEQIPSSEDNAEHGSSESSISEEDNTHWLSDQQFMTGTGRSVDINLPRISNKEECTFVTPSGKIVRVDENDVSGVTPHSASDYVSCRIVVGPMDESLLGEWTLCGSYVENEVEHKRCQRADIVWRNSDNPHFNWQTTVQPLFEHVVHFGGTLNPTVVGSGSVVSCHLVTPDGEDLRVTRNSAYPNVRLVESTDTAACVIAIGPIAEKHLGNWILYGTFNSVLFGYNEVRLPMNLDLYDKNNPYEQSYNVTILTPTQHVINIGSTIAVEVTGTGAVDGCSFITPSGMMYYSTEKGMPTGVSFVNDNRVACQISIGPITETMLGEWLLIGKFSNRDTFTERKLSFTIIQEDPSNPIEEERTVTNLTERNIDTDIGASERVTIPLTSWNTVQSCHIRTPEGLQYTIMEGFHIPGIEVETGSSFACSIVVKVSEDLIGQWTLIAREIRSSELIERRLPFNIRVEELVEALPSEITITEGNDLHVRLAKPTSLHDSCRLIGPDDEESLLATRDDRHIDSCGFVLSDVRAGHSGRWRIVYGTKIIYKALVSVNVNARLEPDVLHLTWLEHSSVSETLGPEEAVYCRVVTPWETVVFDGFGRCQIEVNEVLLEHAGVWSMIVGLPGHIVTEQHRFVVDVKTPDEKAEVLTSVYQDKPVVELTCSVTSGEPKTGCLFRGPQGQVFVASQGVREDRYSFHVNQTSSEAGEHYSCGLQITDPVTSDLGIWRCDLQSQQDVYYGFISALCPFAMQDPEVAAIVEAEPVLRAAEESILAVEGAPVALACAARAPLRYCYFRAPNGAIFNVGPGTSSPGSQYAGAGLDAGECGARFAGLLRSDSGAWSCHAGFHGATEQSSRVSVVVQEEMTLRSAHVRGLLVLEARVRGDHPLDYCRFVRNDGFGFTSDDIPFPYIDESALSFGVCRIRAVPTPVDMRPWTVVAKLRGRDGEISRVTPLHQVTGFSYNYLLAWMPFLLILFMVLLVGAALAPARNRRWAAERASRVRTSLRRWPSFQSKPKTNTNPAA